MTPLGPDESQDVLAYGGDRPPRRTPPLLVGGLVGLAAGLALGLSLDARNDPEDSPASSPGPTDESAPAVAEVAVGAITKLGPHADSAFLLAVYNGGDEELTATVAALPGWMAPLGHVTPTAVRPHSWAHVVFEAQPDCAIRPGTVRSVRLQVRTADGLTDRVALLPQQTEALNEHHEAVCGAD